MARDFFSRRSFLRNVAAGSMGAAVAGASNSRANAASRVSEMPPFPVTVESFPLAHPGKPPVCAHLKIVTQHGIPEAYLAELRELSPQVEFRVCNSKEEFRRQVADAHVIYGPFSREDLAASNQLRWIQYTAAGVERILWPELVDSPVVLTNMQRVYAPVISETVLGLLLALARGINRYAVQTRECQWQPVRGLVEVSGMTLGLVGLGGIGTETAYRAHYGFGMEILAVDPKPLPKPKFVVELHTVDWLPTMVTRVDVLVSAAPHTKATEKMFNESVFRAMKPTAYFINVSRGKLVDTPALVRALKEGWIAGAGLDVAHTEPLPPEDPLWSAPNLLVTCHTSGHSPRTAARQMALFLENVRRYLAGWPLLNVVDKQRGY